MTAYRVVSRVFRDSVCSHQLGLAVVWQHQQRAKQKKIQNVKIIQMVWRAWRTHYTRHTYSYVRTWRHRMYKNEQQREFYTFCCFFPVRSFFGCFVSQLFMVEINVCGDQTKAKVECDSTSWIARERGRGRVQRMEEETQKKTYFECFEAVFWTARSCCGDDDDDAHTRVRKVFASNMAILSLLYFVDYYFFCVLVFAWQCRRRPYRHPLNMILITIRIYIMWLYIEFMCLLFLWEIADSFLFCSLPICEHSRAQAELIPRAFCDDFIDDH